MFEGGLVSGGKALAVGLKIMAEFLDSDQLAQRPSWALSVCSTCQNHNLECDELL